VVVAAGRSFLVQATRGVYHHGFHEQRGRRQSGPYAYKRLTPKVVERISDIFPTVGREYEASAIGWWSPDASRGGPRFKGKPPVCQRADETMVLELI
jgi:hypothetical protein